MEHCLMVATIARFGSNKGSQDLSCWHPLWRMAMVHYPKACVAGLGHAFKKVTLLRSKQREKKAANFMMVSVLTSKRLLEYQSRTIATNSLLETREYKKVQDAEDFNTFRSVSTDVSELNAPQVDSPRLKLARKLSEANQYNRILQRKVIETDETLLKCKRELATMETELEMLVKLAQEIAGGKSLAKKINGRYVSSHLLLRLQDLHHRIRSQIKDVDAMHLREVPLEWYGMAEHVQIMGSFDGWTQGEHMSPENTLAYTFFTASLKLRPGEYEIKFIVDGIWQTSPRLPTIGEGMTRNNLLIVD